VREEETVLKAWLKLCDRQTTLKKKIKEAEEGLDLRVYERYAGLSEVEVKALVVVDKWLTRIGEAIVGEMERVSQGLTQRVRVLAERYEVALPELTSRVADLEAKVAGHLERMGFLS
jgi:type I restriction enzyme M protein